ncbi:MAG: alcohol dehydrogenase catalytic domain-containing protein [Oscillospiraceae bacterium]|nr:alcohol dehydrogenase catalytic domain-containing protein [Oscillospiraceae bacterium]
MKSVAVTKVGKLNTDNEADRGVILVRDIPEPILEDEQVRIKVAYCSICGSDPHCMEENIFNWDVPFGVGHEMSGVVVEVGKKATKRGLKVGDRVAGNFLNFCGTCYYCVNGQEQFCEHCNESNQPCMSENVTWHESQVYKIPDNVSLKEACLLEPVSVCVRVMDKVDGKIGQRVAINGGGPIGLLCLQMMKMMGAVNLTLFEPLEARRELGKKYGADYCVDPISQDVIEVSNEITGGMGFDVVIEVSGNLKAAYTMPEIMAKGGKLMYVAMYPNDHEMPLNLCKTFFNKELTLTGTYVSPYAFPRATQIMPRLQLDDFTAAVYDIDDVQEAFKAQVSGKYPKVLIRCNQFKGE